VVKNKVAAPFKSCEFDIMYNEGISVAGDLIDTGVENGVVKKSGASYSFGDIKLGVGREVAKQSLKSDPKLMDKLRKELLAAIEIKELGGK
jgi:recombination protein RecA